MSGLSDNEAKNLSVHGLKKHYGKVAAVDDISFDVAAGTLVTLLGPSGCGKTTTLRMIGGLVEPTAGRITIAGRDITTLPPWKRNCGFVFQSYALFPHMTVRDNIGYGLKLRGWENQRIREKIDEVAGFMDIAVLLDRLPRNLSGGQQQRSAVARAIAIEPDVLLMDEPLANLDAQLRDRIRDEIRRLQHELGVTIIYVTHDQAEAFSISDQVLVINAGRVVQKGNPQQIFARPASTFVASFVGVNNLLGGRVVTVEADEATIEWNGCRIRGHTDLRMAVGDRAIAVIGAQSFNLEGQGSNPAVHGSISGEISAVSFQGNHYRISLRTQNDAIVAELSKDLVEHSRLEPGSPIALAINNAFIIPEDRSDGKTPNLEDIR